MLTRFEKARIIGARALQISMGAPVLIKIKKGMSPTDIVKKEMEEGVLPLAVVRKTPDGRELVLNIKGEVIGEAKQ